jgi:hypothetical protein
MTAESAKVTSIDALDSFKASLIVYRDRAGAILDEISGDVARTRIWLETERLPHWKRLVQQRTKELGQAKQELMTAQLSEVPETVKARRLAVHKAELSLRDAEEGLARVKHWIRRYETQVESRLKTVTKLRDFLASEMGKGVVFLEGATASLIEYAETKPPPSGAPIATDAPDPNAVRAKSPGKNVAADSVASQNER